MILWAVVAHCATRDSSPGEFAADAVVAPAGFHPGIEYSQSERAHWLYKIIGRARGWNDW